MRWNHRFEFVMEAVHKAAAETGERKGHYLNVTSATPEEMYKRAAADKPLGACLISPRVVTNNINAKP